MPDTATVKQRIDELAAEVQRLNDAYYGTGDSPLPDAGVWASPADAGRWPFRLRLIEAEVALRLSRDVDAALAATLDHAQAAVSPARGLRGHVHAHALNSEVVCTSSAAASTAAATSPSGG